MDKTRNAHLACAALLLLLVAACSATSDGQRSALTSANVPDMISLIDAVTIAQAEVPDGMAVEAELELEDDDDPPAYEVVFFVRDATQLIEVEVHAFTGEVLEVEVDDDDYDDDDDDYDDDDDDDYDDYDDDDD